MTWNPIKCGNFALRLFLAIWVIVFMVLGGFCVAYPEIWRGIDSSWTEGESEEPVFDLIANETQ